MLVIFVYLTNKHVIIIHHVCSVRIFTQLYDPKKLKVFEKKSFQTLIVKVDFIIIKTRL